MIKFIQLIVSLHLIILVTLLPVHKAGAFSIAEEKELGEKLLYTVRSNFKVLDQPDIQQYIDSLGEEVLNVAGIQYFDYHFFIINNKEFNAFAAPSGLIFFQSGLIDKMDSENELVSVLAHEIGHIVKRHIASRADKGKKITIATMGLMLASLALGGGAATEALFAGSLAAGQTASLHFSRLDEEEADLLAYDWMKKMNRDPEGQVKMLKTMRQIARYRSTKIPQYLLTHPNPEARLDYVQTLVERDQTQIDKNITGDDFAFLRFKYRIMSQTKDNMYFRGMLASIVSSPRSSSEDRIMAKYGLSQLERAENNYPKALQYLEEVMETFPDRNILFTDKGIIELEGGRGEQAYDTLTKSFNKDRTDMYATYALAKACFALKKYDQAEGLLKTVMYKMPEYSQVYFDLGKLHSFKNYQAETLYYLGKFYLSQGKLDIAKKNLEGALKDERLESELTKHAKNDLELIKRLKKD